MELTTEQKKAILKAIQAGEISPEEITPQRYITAYHSEHDPFVTIDGEPVAIERFEAMRAEIEQANESRKRLGLPLHRITILSFENYDI
jgi:hypothetical protein